MAIHCNETEKGQNIETFLFSNVSEYGLAQRISKIREREISIDRGENKLFSLHTNIITICHHFDVNRMHG